MVDRRRWVDVWWAPDREAALERAILQRDERVAAAFAGDRKWCVLVERRDPRELLHLEALVCRCGDAGDQVISDEDGELLAVAGTDAAPLIAYVRDTWDTGYTAGEFRIRRGHWRYDVIDPCDECGGDGFLVWRGQIEDPCWGCDGVGAQLTDRWETGLFWHDDPDGHVWVHGEVVDDLAEHDSTPAVAPDHPTLPLGT